MNANGLETHPATHVLDCGCERQQGMQVFQVGTQWWCQEHKRFVLTVQIHPRLYGFELK